MQNIETTIVELGSIFQQLAHMVKEQEEVVQRWAGVIENDRDRCCGRLVVSDTDLQMEH